MKERFRCKAAGKKRYRDHREVVKALQGAKRSREEGNLRAMAVRGYPCTACRGWHVTSQAPPPLLIDPTTLMRTA
jgi:hypothetical protein